MNYLKALSFEENITVRKSKAKSMGFALYHPHNSDLPQPSNDPLWRFLHLNVLTECPSGTACNSQNHHGHSQRVLTDFKVGQANRRSQSAGLFWWQYGQGYIVDR